jgi:hypothetical protein
MEHAAACRKKGGMHCCSRIPTFERGTPWEIAQRDRDERGISADCVRWQRLPAGLFPC